MSESSSDDDHLTDSVESHHGAESSDSGAGKNKPAENYNQAVNRSKIFVSIAILIAAAGAGIATWFVFEEEEAVWYRDELEEFAEVVHGTTNTRLSTAKTSMTFLGDSYRSLTEESLVEVFPNVTLPHFVQHAAPIHELAKPLVVAMAPLVASHEELQGWEQYAVENQGWITEDLEQTGFNVTADPPGNIRTSVYALDDEVDDVPRSRYAPLWQMSPVPKDAFKSPIMLDVLSIPWLLPTIEQVITGRFPIYSSVHDCGTIFTPPNATKDEDRRLDADDESQNEDAENEEEGEDRDGQPCSVLVGPIFKNFDDDAAVVALSLTIVAWTETFTDILEDEAVGTIIVLQESCASTSYTFFITDDGVSYGGQNVTLEAGFEDLHHVERSSANTVESSSDSGDDKDGTDERRLESSESGEPRSEDAEEYECQFYVAVNGGSEYVANWQQEEPIQYSLIVVFLFLATSLAFAFLFFYVLAMRRNRKVEAIAKRSTDIVASLFPANVRDRIMQQNEKKNSKAGTSPFLVDDDAKKSNDSVIADFYPATTILFADIAGFTAWASVRDPKQVFTLLETLYGAFDESAKRRRVYKIETVGDCYVAATGLPIARKDHAVMMARFARDMLTTMRQLSKQLEVKLGPDTGDLALRVGIHSGPITGGVLRGDNARFQLFGDTMNTAARMEHNGIRDRIQISQETADLLTAAGKTSWFVAREDKINAKGKGALQTFWLLHQALSGSKSVGVPSTDSSKDDTTSRSDQHGFDDLTPSNSNEDLKSISPKTRRLIDWNVDILTGLLKLIAADHDANPVPAMEKSPNESRFNGFATDDCEEVLAFPAKSGGDRGVPEMDLEPNVIKQLRLLVSLIAMSYNDNKFHDFSHAAHVTMSTMKLLKRIVERRGDDNNDIRDALVDPISQFTVVFAAFIHDVDHQGVPNAQLIKEGTETAKRYGKNIAERHSVDIVWKLLMDPRFEDLRMIIYRTDAELIRFRQLLIECVLSTDICDPELQQISKQRWQKAFGDSVVNETEQTVRNRKATVVMSNLIRVSDISHTMQHWHVFRKWNSLLFDEMYMAYKQGRAEKDPSKGWYESEIGFFDFYIIPLAKKLKDCGVFGVSSDEYLQYAKQNRQEWEDKGKDIVAEMLESFESRFGVMIEV